MPTAEEAAAANAAYRAANGYPVDPNNTRILSTPTGQAYLQQQQQQAAQQDAYLDQQKHERLFHGPAEPAPSAAFLAINAQYASSRNQVVSSGGSVYQGPVSNNINPYPTDTAAGIAWEVSKTGGATDTRLNRIAEQQVLATGGDPGFIRYASDIYVERPAYQREVLTSKIGQTFVNEAWAGVPIRLNLTRAEMAMGAGITPDNVGKYYKYNSETFMLGRLNPAVDTIGIDTGVHTKVGDFGGPILQGDGSYGGWRPQGSGRLVGGNMVAGIPTTETVTQDMGDMGMVKPFRAPGDSQPTYFTDVGYSIKNTIGLGMIYSLGESISPSTKSDINRFVSTAPILSSVFAGGNVFELKSDYERIASSTEKSIAPLTTEYSSKLGVYNKQLEEYNVAIDAYNKNPTASEYTRLSNMEIPLSLQKSSLDKLKNQIDFKLTPSNSAEQKYNAAAGALTGNINQSDLITYGIGKGISDIGTGYQNIIEQPSRKFLSGFGIVGEFGAGVISIPTQLTFMGQSALVGGETIIRNAQSLPGLATAGLAMQAKGTYEMATTKPAELAGTLVGMYVIGSVGGMAVERTVGIVRTRGQTYVPIEDIGYTARGRYPLNPVQSESQLARSFSEGRLYPAPRQMAEGGTVPYLHGEGGVPVARLPNAHPGESVMWTALESSSRARGIGVGEAYRLVTSGGSEVRGLYGAPIAESYFAKVGSAIPQMIGFKLPGTPTIYSTVVEGLESIPRGLRESLPRNSAGKITESGWEGVNRYIQTRSAEAPSGQGYMPMLKAEYEAIIPDNTVLEVTGRNYYTKLGGFGESHFMGTRVPIIEQRSIGFEPGLLQTTTPAKNLGESYTPRPIINLMSSAPSITASSSVITLSGRGTSSADLSTASSSNIVSSIITPKENTGYQSRSNSYSKQLSGDFGSSKNALSSSISPILYSGAISYKASVISQISGLTSITPYQSTILPPIKSGYQPPTSPPPYIPPYTPPVYTPGRTPPITPNTPTPQVPPIIPLIPGLPLLPSGGSSSPFGRKRRYNFMEVFNMGLDIGGPIMTAPRGMKPPRVKRSSLPGGRQKIKVSKKKR
jgi:hypothetical protein